MTTRTIQWKDDGDRAEPIGDPDRRLLTARREPRRHRKPRKPRQQPLIAEPDRDVFLDIAAVNPKKDLSEPAGKGVRLKGEGEAYVVGPAALACTYEAYPHLPPVLHGRAKGGQCLAVGERIGDGRDRPSGPIGILGAGWVADRRRKDR
jgi:hypothetical protein